MRHKLKKIKYIVSLGIALSYLPQKSFANETLPASIMQLAQQGDAPAQFNLGLIYYQGQGVPQDYSKAVEWYTKAAGQKYALAQYNLGVSYRDGHGVLQDYSSAAKWFTKAANQGDAQAQYNLGVMYKKGQGVPQDNDQAKSYFKQSCLNRYQQGCKAYKILNNP